VHELSICHSLLDRACTVASEHSAQRILAITVRIGPLSGVEPQLLAQAFPMASAGTAAEAASLVIETLPVRLLCEKCGAESEALPNRLLCARCGDHRTRITSGDELLMTSVKLETA